MPKNGSTFVRTFLTRLHRLPRIVLSQPSLRQLNNLVNSGFKEYHWPNIREKGPSYGQPDQHGTWDQVPERFRSLPVVMVVRNPLDRYVSEFHYRWWAEHEIVDRSIVLKELPNFPILSFEEFLRYKEIELQVRRGGLENVEGIGSQTVEFLQMLFRDPLTVLSNLDSQYISSGNYTNQLPDKLHLLRMEYLNKDLHAFLRTMGYSDARTNQVLQESVIQPNEGTARVPGSHWRDLYSESLIKKVVYKERFLLQILRDLGINYPIE
jgi:hypothetical protein